MRALTGRKLPTADRPGPHQLPLRSGPVHGPEALPSLEWSYSGLLVQPESSIGTAAPRIVRDVLEGAGALLGVEARRFFEPRFQHDFSAVRVHTGPAAGLSARAIQARAYTAGNHIVFGEGQFAPGSTAGKELLAHELAHVVQQPAGRIHRRVSMRDVGRGEHSGFARLPELVERLSRVANGLVFLLDTNNNLTYQENPYGTLTEFERRMQGFIDSGTVIPLRLTNHEGLVGSHALGFHNQVSIDEYDSAYVDVDDMLASDDLNLQTALIHLITERAATRDYARRVGTFIDENTGILQNQAEFDRAHASGLDAETQVVRDFFHDPTIRLVNEPDSGPFDRVWRNSRRDLIRERRTTRAGVDALSTSVLLRDGRTMNGEEYRDFLASQAAGANP